MTVLTREIPGRSMRPDGLTILLLVVALAAWTFVTSKIYTGHVGDFQDDGLYLVSSQSLRDGKGYQLPSRPGPPIRSRYSIGFPALITLGMLVAPGTPSLGRDVFIARAVVAVGCWIFASATFLWLRRLQAPRPVALLIATAAAWNPTTLKSGVVVMSDVPYAALAAILLVRWASRRPRSGPSALLDGLLAGFGFTLRGNGVALILGSLLACRRGASPLRRTVLCLVGVAVGALPLVAYTRLAAGPHVAGGYGLEMAAGWRSAGSAWKVLTDNVEGIVASGADFVLPIAWTRHLVRLPVLGWAARAVIDAIILVGAVSLARRGGRRGQPAWAFALVTLAIFLVWPWQASTRFLLGLLPLVWWAFFNGLLALAKFLGLGRMASIRLGIATLVGAVAFNGLWSANSARQALRNGGNLSRTSEPELAEDMEAMIAQIRDRLEPDAVVAALNPELVYLYTGKQSYLLLEETEVLTGVLSGRERLESWLTETAGRPLYLLSKSTGPSGQGSAPLAGEARQVASFAGDPDLSIRPVARGPRGILQLVAVARRKPGPEE